MRKLSSLNGWHGQGVPTALTCSSFTSYKSSPTRITRLALYCSVFLSQPYKEDSLLVSNLVCVLCFRLLSCSSRRPVSVLCPSRLNPCSSLWDQVSPDSRITRPSQSRPLMLALDLGLRCQGLSMSLLYIFLRQELKCPLRLTSRSSAH